MPSEPTLDSELRSFHLPVVAAPPDTVKTKCGGETKHRSAFNRVNETHMSATARENQVVRARSSAEKKDLSVKRRELRKRVEIPYTQATSRQARRRRSLSAGGHFSVRSPSLRPGLATGLPFRWEMSRVGPVTWG